MGFSDLNDEGYWIPPYGFRDLVMFKKDQILVLICIGLMIQLGKSSPSTRYAAESEMKGHPPMMDESTDSTASGADREKQFFDFYVQPGYEPTPHYVQPKYEPEPPKEYKPEPPKQEYEPEPPKEYKPEPPKPEYEPKPPKEYKPEPPKPDYEPEPPKDYGRYGDHKNVVLIDGSLNKVDLNSGVRVALSGEPEYKPEPPKEYIPEPPKEYKPEPPKHGYKPIEEDMDTYVEDDNSYEVIPEVHEPPKHEGKKSGTVQFKTSFKANKVVVHPLILRIAKQIMEAKQDFLGQFYRTPKVEYDHGKYELVPQPHYGEEKHKPKYGNPGYVPEADYGYEPEDYRSGHSVHDYGYDPVDDNLKNVVLIDGHGNAVTLNSGVYGVRVGHNNEYEFYPMYDVHNQHIGQGAKNVILVGGDGHQIKLNLGEIYGMREELDNGYEAGENDDIPEAVYDERYGQLFLITPKRVARKVKKLAKKAVPKLVIYSIAKAAGHAVSKPLGVLLGVADSVARGGNSLPIDVRQPQAFIPEILEVARTSAALAPYAAIPLAVVGGTLGGKYLLVKKLIAKKGFVDGFKTGINGGKLTKGLPLPFLNDGQPESTVDIDFGFGANLERDSQVLPQLTEDISTAFKKAGEDFLKKLPNVKVDVTNKLIVDGDGNVLDVQQYDHAGFELIPYKEPEYDYEHQPSYVPDYDHEVVYYDERSGQFFDLGSIASFFAEPLEDKNLNYGGHLKVDIVEPHLVKKKVVTTKPVVVQKNEKPVVVHKKVVVDKPVVVKKKVVVEKPVVVQKKVVVEKPVVVKKKVVVEKPVVVHKPVVVDSYKGLPSHYDQPSSYDQPDYHRE